MAKVKKSDTDRKNGKFEAFPLIHPHAAGIDIGDRIHAVAVPPGSCAENEEPVRIFGTMTCDLHAISEWLHKCGVDTVAMESTGVYWKPLYSHLVREGLEVFLVQASTTKNVSGRKTDESDAAWIQRLHACGLLKSSYLPGDEQEALRTLVRFRKTLVADASRWVLRIQKSLELMNIKIHTVISNVVGQTGCAILEAIIAGERDAQKFLPLVGKRIKADSDTIIKSLQGNWREEHLFALSEAYRLYEYYQQRIAACDLQVEEQLKAYEALHNDGEIKSGIQEELKEQTHKSKQKNTPRFEVRSYLCRILGIDVLNIHGISEGAGLQILAETGTDMSKWPSAKHFVSWLNLCPNNKISGGKLISSQLMKKHPSLAGQAFRAAANSVQRSDNWLGDYFRRMKAKGGNKYAIVATANKIATIYYRMVKDQIEFQPPDLEEYRQHRAQQKIKYLERKLQELKTGLTE
jgi:transposase